MGGGKCTQGSGWESGQSGPGSGCWHHRLHRAAWQLLQLPGKEERSSRALSWHSRDCDKAGSDSSSTGWEREPPDHPRLPGGERRAGSRLWVAGSTQAGGGRTFRMLVTVGSALRMSLGLGWMLAFSADFRCGACSLSAILGTHKEGRLAGGGGAALLPPKPPQGSAGGHSEGTGSALSWLTPKAKPQPPPGQGAGQPAAPQPVLPAPREEER